MPRCYNGVGISSLPSRERGLKCRSVRSWIFGIVVAPLAGAWIEIMKNEIIGAENIVAPLAGAWIEMTIQMRPLGTEKRRSPRGSVD